MALMEGAALTLPWLHAHGDHDALQVRQQLVGLSPARVRNWSESMKLAVLENGKALPKCPSVSPIKVGAWRVHIVTVSISQILQREPQIGYLIFLSKQAHSKKQSSVVENFLNSEAVMSKPTVLVHS